MHSNYQNIFNLRCYNQCWTIVKISSLATVLSHLEKSEHHLWFTKNTNNLLWFQNNWKKSPNLHLKINLGLANSNNKGNLIKIFFNSSYNVYVIRMAQHYISIFFNLIGILSKVNFYTHMKFLNVLLVLIVCILWIYMVSVKRL